MPVRAEGATARDPEQAHPAAGPQAVAGNRLIGIFRTGRQVSAGVADEIGERQLIETDEARA